MLKADPRTRGIPVLLLSGILTGADDRVEGLRCGANGACEAIPCDEGYPCPSHQVCRDKLRRYQPIASSSPSRTRCVGA